MSYVVDPNINEMSNRHGTSTEVVKKTIRMKEATEEELLSHACMGHTIEDQAYDFEAFDYELKSIHSETDEEERFPLFSEVVGMHEPKFKLKQVFSSLVVLKKAMRRYSVKNILGIWFLNNDTLRVVVKCIEGCDWMLCARRIRDGPKCQIRRLIHEHACAKQTKLRWATFKWIADEYLETICSLPNIPLVALVDHIRRDFNL